MSDLLEIAEKIIEEKGGDKYKRQWLESYLSVPENLDDFMAQLLKRQITTTVKGQSKKKPPKIKGSND